MDIMVTVQGGKVEGGRTTNFNLSGLKMVSSLGHVAQRELFSLKYLPQAQGGGTRQGHQWQQSPVDLSALISSAPLLTAPKRFRTQ